MFCSKCGCENSDSASFCKNCGQPMAGVGGGQPSEQGYNPNMQYTAQCVNSFAGAVIKTLSSSVMTALCIIMSISIGWGLLSSMFSSSLLSVILREAFSAENIYFPEELDGIGSIFGIGSLITSLPNIIILVGMWVMRSSAKNACYNGNMSTGGITAVKVVLTVQLVFQIIATVLCALAGGLFALMADEFGSETYNSTNIDGFDALGYIGAGVFIIIAAVLTVKAVYTSLALSSASNIKRTVVHNTFYKAPSTAYTVISFIFAGFALISGSLFTCAIYAMSAVVNIDMKQNFNTVLAGNRYNFAKGNFV